MYAVANLMEAGQLQEATALSAKLKDARGELEATLYIRSPRDDVPHAIKLDLTHDSESVGNRASNGNRMPAMEPEPFRVFALAVTHEGQQVLEVKGALTSSASAAFNDAVLAVKTSNLILELSGVTMVDSVAVGALVRAFVSCNKSGRKLALVGMNHRVQNVLHITGIAPLFDTYETVAQAEAAIG